MAGVETPLFSLFGGFIALAWLTVPNMNRADCANAAHRYEAAVGKVIAAVRVYERCVSSGNKRDDCAAQMETLDSAQEAFVDVVDDLKSCR